MIAISVTGKRRNSLLDLRFGRSPFFCLFDGKEFIFIDNPFHNDEKDVAPRVVKFLHEKNVKKVITGEIGPKAQKSLEQYQIQTIMLSEDHISLQGVLKKLA